jgi:pimeloyl-ACP methyl ester carboxylesterase
MKRIIVLASLILSAIPLRAAEKVTFTTPDGVRLVGWWFAPKPGKPTVILLHGLGALKEEWRPLDSTLSSAGVGVLAYDQRGHSESQKTASGGTVDFQTFYGQGMGSEWGKMVEDIASAVQFLKKRGVDPKSVGVGGASIGANIAFRYAAAHPEVPFCILLSPGADYQGIRTDDVYPSYGRRPLFAAASAGDRYAYRTVKSFEDLNPRLPGGGALLTLAYEPSGHGAQMFRRSDPARASAFEEKLLHWILERKVRK